MIDILSANQAAKVIGCNANKVQEKLILREWTFGVAYKGKGKTKFTYEINRHELARFLQISEDEIDRRLAER